MAVFTVISPAAERGTLRAAERTVFLPDGFRWAAFLFGPVWLIWQRAWIWLGVWAVFAIALAAAARLGVVYLEAVPGAVLLADFFLGLEGAAIQEAALRRRGFWVSDLVTATDRDVAAALFFRRDRTSEGGAAQTQNYASGEVVGLFPNREPGQ